MAPTKRASGDGVPPPPGKRLRVTVAAPGSSNPEPPSSPRRFLSIVLVVLFLKRPKGRSTDSVPVLLSRIGRLEMEVGRLLHTVGLLRREQDKDRNLIHALTSRFDNITGPSANHHNHERLARQGTDQQVTNAEAEVSATAESVGKDTSLSCVSTVK